jgi:thiosulfate/3-mercaptopyruvate sulfurtransferase
MTGVVSPAWLAERLEEVQVVDVRDQWEYDGIGHVPGAVNIPFDSFRSPEGEAGMLPPTEEWIALLSEAGITADDDVVAYDDTNGVFAARFLVTAELLGHDPERLHLLNGDYSAWTREYEASTDEPESRKTTYEVSQPESTPLVDYDAVLAAIEDAEVGPEESAEGTGTVIVDTRERHEYEEAHVPGAVLLDWRELVDDETRGLKPRAELESILADRGITPDRRVLLYCNTARRISHTYVVLRHLGYEDIAFYEGSLTEWEERGGPVESGAPKADPVE